jgi:polyisoprenoid-binding protein YceI
MASIWSKLLILLAVVLAVVILAFYLLRDPYRASQARQATVEEPTSTTQPTEAEVSGERVVFESAELMFTGSSALGEQPGFFEQVSGELVLGEDGTPLQLTGTVQMASVLTNADSLTNKLKTEPGMFEVDRYPTADFVSTAIRPASGEAAAEGATHQVQGNFTLRGVTKSVSFPATIEVTPQKVMFSSEFAVNRQDFGVNYDGGAAFPEIRDLVLINLDFEASRTPCTPSNSDEPSTRPAS